MTMTRSALLLPLLLLAACGGNGDNSNAGIEDEQPSFSDGVNGDPPTPGVTPESTPETTPVSESDETPETTPGSEPDETPDSTPEATPEESLAFPAGSDLTRIVAGLQRVTGTTLLGLNQKLESGVELTEREQECIGTYEPGLGQPLLAIRCPDAPYLVSGFPIIMSRASFIDSEVCRASLFNAEFTSCQLQEAKLEIQTVFEVTTQADDDETFTPQRPVPISGALISYAQDGSSSLVLSNDESGLTGVFTCEYDLSGAELTSSSASNSCENDARRIADHLDSLVPVL